MIIGIPGNLGDGKSATMARMAMHYSSLCNVCNGIINDKDIIPVLFEEGQEKHMCVCTEPSPYKIHSNFLIYGIPDIHYVTSMEDVDKIYKGFAFLDEFWHWADSRTSSHSDINLAVTGILHKSRKRGYNVVYESKLIHMTDRRVRELTDYILCPNKYINVNGELTKVSQHLLYPMNMEKYFDDTWFVVDEVSGEGMNVINEGLFQFKLSDVADRYDTTEEIVNLAKGEASPGIEKGIKIEKHFHNYIKSIGYNDKIIRTANSRGWDIIVPGLNMCFDVVTVRTDRGKIPTVDIRNKRIPELMKYAKDKGLTPYFAYLYKGDWFVNPMPDDPPQKVQLKLDNSKIFTKEDILI